MAYKSNWNHFILYSKGWLTYIPKHSFDSNYIINNTKRLLNLDAINVLGWYIRANSDAIQIIIMEFDKYNEWAKQNNKKSYTFYEIYNRVVRNMCLYNLNYDASLILTISNIFAFLSKEEISLKPISYNRKLFKQGYIADNKQGMTYKEMNKYMQKIFN